MRATTTTYDVEEQLKTLDGFAREPLNESDGDNERWIRRRAVILREIYENSPDHPRALDSLIEYWTLRVSQPIVFAKLDSAVHAEEFSQLNHYVSSTTEVTKQLRRQLETAIQQNNERAEHTAQQILKEHANSPLAEWAYHVLLEQSLQVLQTTNKKDKKYQSTILEVQNTFDTFIEFRRTCPALAQPEHYPGYLEFGINLLVTASDWVDWVGNDDRLAFLRRIEEIAPDHELLQAHLRKYGSIGQKFELVFQDLQTNQSADISDWKNAVILIDFWATWCPPCIKAFKILRRLNETYNKVGLRIVGVSSDMVETESEGVTTPVATPTADQQRELEENILEFAKRNRVNWSIFVDHAYHASYAVSSVPTIFAIDRNQRLRSVDVLNLSATAKELLYEEQSTRDQWRIRARSLLFYTIGWWLLPLKLFFGARNPAS